jgi:tetratricopeptide (TPR) repeat protein
MAISDWLRRRPASSQPDDLLPALLDGFERKDYPGLMRLINDNADRIRTEFKSWTKVPQAVSQDPAALNRYVTTLFNIASLFEKSGDPSLKECLGGSGPDNPLRQWNETLERAGQLTDGGGAAQAVTLLRGILDQMRGATGTGIDHFRPRVLGRLGAALAKLGENQEAIRVTREALEWCRRSGDEEGVRVCSGNLNAIGTYDITDASSQHRYRVVFTDPEGRTLAPEELPGPTGHVKWEIRDTGTVHPEAGRLHDEGRAAGEKGDHDAAIALFTEVAALDPAWPYPVYDRAFAHLFKKEFDAALGDYRRTLELAPSGFFLASTAADMLAREAAGEFPRGLYAAFAMLEHMPKEQQLSIAEQLVQRFPTHAPAWELHAQSVEDPAARLEVIERGLGARPDPETRGSLLIQKAMALHFLGEREQALEILEPMTASIGDSLSAQSKAFLVLATIRSGTRQSAG